MSEAITAMHDKLQRTSVELESNQKLEQDLIEECQNLNAYILSKECILAASRQYLSEAESIEKSLQNELIKSRQLTLTLVQDALNIQNKCESVPMIIRNYYEDRSQHNLRINSNIRKLRDIAAKHSNWEDQSQHNWKLIYNIRYKQQAMKEYVAKKIKDEEAKLTRDLVERELEIEQLHTTLMKEKKKKEDLKNYFPVCNEVKTGEASSKSDVSRTVVSSSKRTSPLNKASSLSQSQTLTRSRAIDITSETQAYYSDCGESAKHSRDDCIHGGSLCIVRRNTSTKAGVESTVTERTTVVHTIIDEEYVLPQHIETDVGPDKPARRVRSSAASINMEAAPWFRGAKRMQSRIEMESFGTHETCFDDDDSMQRMRSYQIDNTDDASLKGHKPDPRKNKVVRCAGIGSETGHAVVQDVGKHPEHQHQQDSEPLWDYQN